MLDQNKSRIFEKPKIEYTLRTINSLILSCEYAIKEFQNLNANIVVQMIILQKKILNL